ncbi:hypothetical protein [Halobaculum sp. MBLA0143]|uniref:hypothetical protein n=1 Tax=Halobaculum sp. MBLA0143 TaxID=3079933 RepID=UPI00352372F3
MTDTLKLPDGSVVSPDDVFLYNGYPYRYVPVDEERSADGAGDGTRSADGAGDGTRSADGAGDGTRSADGVGDGTGSADGAGDGVERTGESTRQSPGPEPPDFYLSPLYWGGGEMDVPFDDRAALADQWEASESGVLGPDEWASWLADARGDDRFDDAELDAVARELPGGDTPGLLDRLRRFVG